MLKEKEELFLELFWESGEDMTSVDLAEIIPNKEWGSKNDANVHRIINSLLKKGMIRVCGYTQYRTQYARKFQPTLTREEYNMAVYSEKGLARNSAAEIALSALKFAQTQESRGEAEDTALSDMLSQIETVIADIRRGKKANENDEEQYS